MEVKNNIVPYGYCHCGCGGKTNIAKTNSKKRNQIKGKHFKFIRGHNTKRENHYSWSNGKYKDQNGYVLILCPNHNRTDSKGYVREHILIVEKIIGYPLPRKAVIHHVNGIKSDNHPSNLVLCQDDFYHKLLHQRQTSFDACAHVNWRKCWICQEYDNPENLDISYGHSARHTSCIREYNKKYLKRKSG